MNRTFSKFRFKSPSKKKSGSYNVTAPLSTKPLPATKSVPHGKSSNASKPPKITSKSPNKTSKSKGIYVHVCFLNQLSNLNDIDHPKLPKTNLGGKSS